MMLSLLFFLIPGFAGEDRARGVPALDELPALGENEAMLLTGREIPSIAPLYPEMSQILSAASSAYRRGAELLEQGRTQEALQTLSSAGQRITDVRRIYRFNGQAYSLALELDRLTGEAALRRSEELTEEARMRLAFGRDEITLRLALEAAEQAIALNKDNAEARAEKERIMSLMGNRAAAPLTAQDEARYFQAVTAIQAGNLIEAKILAEQLLLKPENRALLRVIDLKSRIDSLL
jgi:hypothetical protein